MVIAPDNFTAIVLLLEKIVNDLVLISYFDNQGQFLHFFFRR